MPNDLIIKKLQDTTTAITNSRSFEVSVVGDTVRAKLEQVEALLGTAKSLTIEDNADLEFANEIKTDMVTLCKSIEKSIEPWKQAFNRAHKMTTEIQGLLTKGLVEENKALGKRMREYENRQEAVRREAEVKAQATTALVLKQARDTEAARLEAAGKIDDAQRVREQPLTVPQVLLPSHVPETPGSYNRDIWLFEIENPDEVPRDYCCPDEKKIRAQIKITEGKTEIPGIRVYRDEQKITRAKI